MHDGRICFASAVRRSEIVGDSNVFALGCRFCDRHANLKATPRPSPYWLAASKSRLAGVVVACIW